MQVIPWQIRYLIFPSVPFSPTCQWLEESGETTPPQEVNFDGTWPLSTCCRNSNRQNKQQASQAGPGRGQVCGQFSWRVSQLSLSLPV